MWQQNKFTKEIGIKYPIILAGMAGGATTPELVAAVSNSGGLGTLGAGYMSGEEIRTAIQTIRTLTTKPFAVNLFVPELIDINYKKIREMEQTLASYYQIFQLEQPEIKWQDETFFEDQIQVLVEEKVPIFSCTFGFLPDKWIHALKAVGTLLIGTATTVKEGLLLQKHGMDAVVAQGSEAGGHRGTFTCETNSALIGTLALVPQMVDAIELPVIAAGGIMDERGVLASLALGASAAQLGTAFLTVKESGANPTYKKALLASTDTSTQLTKMFSGKAARGIKNKFITEMEQYSYNLPDYPIQHALTQPLRKEAAKRGNPEYMSLWAGQAAKLCREETTEQFMKRITSGIHGIVDRLTERPQ